MYNPMHFINDVEVVLIMGKLFHQHACCFILSLIQGVFNVFFAKNTITTAGVNCTPRKNNPLLGL